MTTLFRLSEITVELSKAEGSVFASYNECPKIHVRFEFGAIYAVRSCPCKTKDNLTTDSSGLLQIELYTKKQRVFIVEQYFKNNEGLAVTLFLVQNMVGIVIELH